MKLLMENWRKYLIKEAHGTPMEHKLVTIFLGNATQAIELARQIGDSSEALGGTIADEFEVVHENVKQLLGMIAHPNNFSDDYIDALMRKIPHMMDEIILNYGHFSGAPEDEEESDMYARSSDWGASLAGAADYYFYRSGAVSNPTDDKRKYEFMKDWAGME